MVYGSANKCNRQATENPLVENWKEQNSFIESGEYALVKTHLKNYIEKDVEMLEPQMAMSKWWMRVKRL